MRVYQRRKRFGLAASLFLLVGFLATPLTAAAQITATYDLPLGTMSPVDIVLTIINWFLSILAIVAVGLLIWGGFLIMTAAGDPEKVTKGKRVLYSTGIGLVIILASWGIVQYVFGILGFDGSTVEGGNFGPGGCANPPCGWLDTGNPFHVSSTDPRDGELNVVLCQSVTFGFSMPIDTEIAAEQDGDEYVNFSLKVLGGGVGGDVCVDNGECASGVCSAGACAGEQVPGSISFSESAKHLVFYPESDYLQNTEYRAELSTAIVAIPEEGGFALDSTDPKRIIEFTTGAETDEIPPTVAMQSAFKPFPEDGAVDICRTTPIQVTFNESLDVTSVGSASVWLFGEPDATDPTQDIAVTNPDFSSLEDGDSETDDTNNTFVIYPDVELDANSAYGLNLYSGDAANNFDGAIRDTCGNPLDGNFDGVAEGANTDDFIPPANATQAQDAGYEYKWTFTTGETIECTPQIDAITPTSGFYSEDGPILGTTDSGDSDLVTITGSYLYPFTSLDFENNVSAVGTNCFDAEHNPNMSCVVAGTQNEVVVRTPSRSVTGPIEIENENGSSESTEYTVNSPFIYALSPDNGPVGQFITIRGRNFIDNAIGNVYFGSERIPAELPCADGWDDDEIIVQVPNDFSVGQDPIVQIERADGKWSNQVRFDVKAGDPGPGLCELRPTCSDDGAGDVTLIGEAFGDDGDVFFNETPSIVQSYSNTEIVTDGIPVADPDTYEVGVVVNGTPSNGIFFEIPCQDVGVPRVKLSSTCDYDADLFPTPNPQPEATNTCLNAFIGAQFENVPAMNMTLGDRGSVLENISVKPCIDITCSSKNISFPVSGQVIPDPSNPTLGFRFIPSQNFSPGSIYQVTISGAVESTEGVKMGADYVWKFTTTDGTDICPIEAVDVVPEGLVFNSTDLGQYSLMSAVPYGPNCSAVKPQDFSWTWNASDWSVIAGSYIQGDYRFGVRPLASGTATVFAEADGVTGEEDVTVDLAVCESDLDCDACGGAECDETINRCRPVIDGVSPGDGATGTWATISGCYFGSEPGSVQFSGTDVNFPDAGLCGDTWSDTEVIVEVNPDFGAGPYDVTLTSSYDLTTETPGSFTVNTTERPGLCRIEPNIGLNGDEVQLIGKNFGEGTNACETAYRSHHENRLVRGAVNAAVGFFNTYVAPIRALAQNGDCTPPVGAEVEFTGDTSEFFLQWWNSFITTSVPEDAQTGDVFVRATQNGPASNALEFIVQCTNNDDCGDGLVCEEGICVPEDWCLTDKDCDECADATCDIGTHTCSPVIETISPDSGPEGRAVTISGCYFGEAKPESIVLMDDKEAPGACGAASWTDSEIIVEVPEGVTGDVSSQMDTIVRKVVENQTFDSNAVTFTESAYCIEGQNPINIPDPNGIPKLCSVNEDPVYRLFDMTLNGDRLNGTSGGTVVFTQKADPNNSATYDYAAGDLDSGPEPGIDHSLTFQTPLEAPVGSNNVVVEVDSCPSNAITVNVDGRPRVSGTYPEQSEQNVCLNSQITVTFSARMDYQSVVENISVTNEADEEIPGTMRMYSAGEDESVAYFLQDDLLPSNNAITVTVNGDGNVNDGTEEGVLSLDGLGMDGDYTFSFRTTENEEPCQVDRVDVDPSEHLFSGQEGASPEPQDFNAVALDASNRPLTPLPSYGWTWEWALSEEPEGVVSLAAAETETASVSPIKDGETSLFATASITGTDQQFWDFANIIVFFCQEPRFFTGFSDHGHYFRTYYCQDDYTTVDFKESDFVRVPYPAGGALQEWFLLSNSDDAIGFRVFPNEDRLNITDWFNEKAPNPDADTKSVVVDDYPAAQVGRTTYINAANFNSSSGALYPNIYLASYNQNASEEAMQIFSDVLEHLTFNTNLPVEDQANVRRDTRRITDLGSLALSIEKYYAKNTSYPSLEAGTYVQRISTSTWPSWDATLGNALGVAPAQDPLNLFEQGSGLCAENYEQATCFNSVDKQFQCPTNSNVYLYKVAEDATSVKLYGHLELENSSWVNYSLNDDPCANVSGAECACFNYEITSQDGQLTASASNVALKNKIFSSKSSASKEAKKVLVETIDKLDLEKTVNKKKTLSN